MINVPGLLIHDDSKRDWRERVRAAAQRYRDKKWLVPDLCYASAQTLGVDLGLTSQQLVETIDGIEVYATRDTQPDYFWIARRQGLVTKGPGPAAENDTNAQLSLL